MTHATCMHAVKNYKMYKKTNKKLDEIEKLFTFKSKLSIDEIDRVHYLENKCKLLESKYKSPLFELIRNIPEDKETEAIERIGLMLSGWDWKNKM